MLLFVVMFYRGGVVSRDTTGYHKVFKFLMPCFCMRNKQINVRIEPRLLKLLEAEAKRKNTSIQEVMREILKSRYTRKAKAGSLSYEDYFAGKPRRKIKSFEDLFSEKR